VLSFSSSGQIEVPYARQRIAWPSEKGKSLTKDALDEGCLRIGRAKRRRFGRTNPSPVRMLEAVVKRVEDKAEFGQAKMRFEKL
jgi:hypothetical protein